MGRALDYGLAVMALARVREDICYCEKQRVRCRDCPVADAFDALQRLVATDPAISRGEMAAAVARRGEEDAETRRGGDPSHPLETGAGIGEV